MEGSAAWDATPLENLADAFVKAKRAYKKQSALQPVAGVSGASTHAGTAVVARPQLPQLSRYVLAVGDTVRQQLGPYVDGHR